MPRRGDNIRKRKDGRWEARYIQCDHNGDLKYKSSYGRTYQEAKKKREMSIKEGNQAHSHTEQITFRELLFAWQESNRVRLKEASISRYQNLIDTHILPELGGKQMDQINTTIINRFLANKLKNGRLDGKGGLSASYVRSITLIIDSAIRFGVAESLCSPLRLSITKPPLPRKELHILNTENQAQLESYLLENMNEEKLMIFITLYSGLRIGEVCALRWEDISLERKLIYIRKTISRVWYLNAGEKRSKLVLESPKTSSSLRYIPICSKLYSALLNFPHKKTCGYILQNTTHTSFVSPRTFEHRYKRILKEANLDVINFHALRHTFATRCIEKGVDIKSLSEILGHADVSITLNTYVHSSVELKRMQLEKLIL